MPGLFSGGNRMPRLPAPDRAEPREQAARYGADLPGRVGQAAEMLAVRQRRSAAQIAARINEICLTVGAFGEEPL